MINHMTSWRCFSILLMMALAGCAGVGPISQWEFDRLPNEKTGIIFASLFRSEKWSNMAHFYLRFRTVGDANVRRGELKYPTVGSVSDLTKPGFEGQVLAFRLLPGTYEISSASIYIPAGMLDYYIFDKRPFSYRFNVIAGKATYLGSFSARPAQVRNIIAGITKPEGLVVEVDDQLSRDIPFLGDLGHKYGRDDIIQAIMTGADTKQSIFLRIE